MRKHVKALAAILLCAGLCLAMTGCVFGASEQEIHFRVYNTIPDQITGVSATYSLDGETAAALETVDTAEEGVTEFVLHGKDIEKKSQLKNFGILFSVQETDGTVLEVSNVQMAVSLGKTYEFETACTDGLYGVWQITD